MKKCIGPCLIGLTGSILSGKSTVLAELARLGAPTLSADKLVHELYQEPSVRKQLETWFGSAEPAVVAKQIFSSPSARQKIEKFLHPLVWKLAQQKLAAEPKPWAIFEAPLLFEAGWEKRMQLTVLVTAPQKTLAARLKARRMSRAEYDERRKTQLDEAEKIVRADVVIYNDGTKKDLETKIKRLYQALTHLYAK